MKLRVMLGAATVEDQQLGMVGIAIEECFELRRFKQQGQVDHGESSSNSRDKESGGRF